MRPRSPQARAPVDQRAAMQGVLRAARAIGARSSASVAVGDGDAGSGVKPEPR
jgi:hypothetical protein